MLLWWRILSNELTDTHVLRGPEAVEALNCYAHELENHDISDLTKSQVDFLIRTAKVLSELISTSEDCKPNQNSQPTTSNE